MTSLLDTITQLSHEFGSDEYVKAGGGNTSCKTDDTLWVKPSGTTLAALTPQVSWRWIVRAGGSLYRADAGRCGGARGTGEEHDGGGGRSGHRARRSRHRCTIRWRRVLWCIPSDGGQRMTCAVGGSVAAARLFRMRCGCPTPIPDTRSAWRARGDPGISRAAGVRACIDLSGKSRRLCLR